MSNDLVTQIADAVAEELNAPESPTVWSQTFTAARVPLVETQPKDLATISGGYKVSVVAGGETNEIETRETDKNILEVAIYIQTVADAATNAAVDAAVALCGQISTYWRARTPAACLGPVCMKRERRALYNVEQLYEDHVATVALVLSFEYHA